MTLMELDTPLKLALNLAGTALTLVCITSMVLRKRRGEHLNGGWWFAIVCLGSEYIYSGVYIPIGPIAWLLANPPGKHWPAEAQLAGG